MIKVGEVYMDESGQHFYRPDPPKPLQEPLVSVRFFVKSGHTTYGSGEWLIPGNDYSPILSKLQALLIELGATKPAEHQYFLVDPDNLNL